ncbi:hypothetical protein LQ567_03620 [Niabella pedocola]|uniref:Alpha-L-rhamnosidase six-hairpin glycosidase domain-containing protein n=1 Tax=Niabella pedocola TaxID=1752077 RepID=A0ABS8PL65_9BACT|nr:hypothetical protein [Niabella pedocola]MCD2421835.1 hypothetical protein [Niabella pedocola]
MIKDVSKRIRNGMILFFVPLCWSAYAGAQPASLAFRSSDTALQNAFYRAKKMALRCRGNPSDPVGPWYEAALPARNAFCIRDVSHQCIPAEVLGMHAENKNIFSRFVSHISESKDWCTYWEMNRNGAPAPEDYRNDREFWYNLNANFELIHACWRMYLWTGDTRYINDPVFKTFFDLTATRYLERWKLQVDSLLTRPVYLNAPVPFNAADYFHRCRGIPSYYEAIHDVKMGIDLVAAIYRGLTSYAAMQVIWKQDQKAAFYRQKAAAYREQLDAVWWNDTTNRYHTYYAAGGTFGSGEGETYLLWYNALTDSSRIRHTIRHLLNSKWNVENRSYLPYQLARYGYGKQARENILFLANPTTERHDYPEVSFGVIEGLVQGVMGIAADARENRITTLYNHPSVDTCELSNLAVLSSRIGVRHWNGGTTFVNNGHSVIYWRASFRGTGRSIRVNGKSKKAVQQPTPEGLPVFYTDIAVAPGGKVTAVIF